MISMQFMERPITEDDIRNSVNTVFVFGDNLKGTGFGGQAKVARQFISCGKAIGIPTKRAPDTTDDSYFSDRDDEIRAVRQSFVEIRQLRRDGKKIVFFPSIGEGLAELDHRSPMIYGIIRGFIESFNDD